MKVVLISPDVNVHRLSQQILKNEPKIIDRYPPTALDGVSDGGTGLGLNSLTSRFFHFNVLNWWGTRKLRKSIRKGYETYTNIKDQPIYVQCWANVMRKGQRIYSHIHDDRFLPAHQNLSGHFNVKVDGLTSTYYDGKPHVNKDGEMLLFPSFIPHWTDVYNGEGERITVAFDIKSADFYKQDVVEEAKSHWVKI
jgi:hypothetical protein